MMREITMRAFQVFDGITQREQIFERWCADNFVEYTKKYNCTLKERANREVILREATYSLDDEDYLIYQLGWK